MYVVKDAHSRHRRGEVPRGGKVNSTCCQVHRNAELVGDSAGFRMYVRTTKLVRTGREILVSFRPDGGFFGGKPLAARWAAAWPTRDTLVSVSHTNNTYTALACPQKTLHQA